MGTLNAGEWLNFVVGNLLTANLTAAPPFASWAVRIKDFIVGPPRARAPHEPS